MRKILISDITMKEETKIGNTLSFKEKLEIAKRLDGLKVDTIELAPSFDNKADMVLARTIAAFVKHSALSCTSSLNKDEIDKAFEAISNAKKKKLQINIPASFAQMEYLYSLKPNKIVEITEEVIKYAKTLCADVEAVLKDATRGDLDFVCALIEKSIEAGATAITICDCDGTMLPEEFYNFILKIYQKTPCLCNVSLALQLNNNLSMANACVFAGIKAGADTIKCSVSGGTVPSLGIVAHTLNTVGDRLGVKSGLNVTELVLVAGRIADLLNGQKKNIKITEKTKEEHENLNPQISIGEMTSIIKKRGYDLSADDISKVYEEFIKLSGKKSVNMKELDVIIASTALQVTATYKLNNFVINSGNIIPSTAGVSLIKEGKELYGLSSGDGPIDAAFLAIENITGHHFELDDFQIQAITEGREAIGEGLVKLRYNGNLYSGRGISTDIIGASIKAYLNALNKIVFEESTV